MFSILEEGQISKRLVGDKFFFGGIFDGKIKIGMPGARVEIDLAVGIWHLAFSI